MEKKGKVVIRSRWCRDCTYNEKQVGFCGIRKIQYESFDMKCPREIELMEHLKE